jgi:hypothetical protein
VGIVSGSPKIAFGTVVGQFLAQLARTSNHKGHEVGVSSRSFVALVVNGFAN